MRTTLESTAQNLAEDLLRARLQELSGTGITVGAVMWTDPATGAVRAYVGSPDYDDPLIQGQRDYAREYLQPGGAIALIVYATAFEGIDRNSNGSIDFGDYTTAGHLAWDVPAQYPGTSAQPAFSPQNINGAYYGPVSVREALANQLAPATTRIYQEYGDAAFVAMAEKMGISFNSDAVFGLPTAAGSTPVRLRDLMTAYGTIANGGMRRTVYVISGIVDSNGVTVELPELIKPPEERVLPAQIAFLLQNILSDDLARFTNMFPRNSALTLGGQPTQNFVGAVAATNQARAPACGHSASRPTRSWAYGSARRTATWSSPTRPASPRPLRCGTASCARCWLGSAAKASRARSPTPAICRCWRSAA
ncbi:MAG: hypothetical protein HND48_17565 [Chloroflexi bacterium]|nr:hypothetical protein [Chloroflexota bacterium]